MNLKLDKACSHFLQFYYSFLFILIKKRKKLIIKYSRFFLLELVVSFYKFTLNLLNFIN